MSKMNNCLACGWTEHESDDEYNPRRRKCPECGATFNNRHEERIFTANGDDSVEKSGEHSE